MVVEGTWVGVDVVIKPNFSFTTPLHARLEDGAGVFKPDVAVKANADGSYTLSLRTMSTVAAGIHSGNVDISLCADAGCGTRQTVPSIRVPFEIGMMSRSSDWPGNHLTVLSGWPGVLDWGTFQGNAAHNGHVPVATDPDRFTTRWQMPAFGAHGSRYPARSTLTAEGGRFFVADGNSKLYARREHDGSEIWQYDVKDLQYPSVNPPAVANGVVYMAAGQQSSTYMFAFDAVSGAVVFKSPMSSQWEHYLAPTIGTQGIYTNAGGYGGLYAFKPTGEQLYFAPAAQTSMWTPAVDASGVYLYTGGKLDVRHPVSGELLASITDPSFENYIYEIGGAPVLGAPGSVFVANYLNSILNDGAIGNTLIKFDLASKSIGWQIPGVYPSTPAYTAGVLYVVNESPVRLEARSEANGTLLWSWVPPLAGDTRFRSEVLKTDTLVFVSTNLATYAIDLATHLPVWSYPQSGRLALSKNGILYIQGEALLTAINLK